MFLWVDPGIRKLWFAVINSNMEIFELWAIVNELKWGREDNIRRFSDISSFFDELLEKYEISWVCIEKLFFTKFNQANAEFVYWVRGILLDKFYKKNIKVLELSPKEIKKFTTWNGNASKTSMQNTIKKLFSLEEVPQPHDAADALAMALLAFKKFRWIK
jgi:crossover junction endodeoxyribonuclease RuvC